MAFEVANTIATLMAIQYAEEHFFKYVILRICYKISTPLPIKAIMPLIIILAQNVDMRAILKECLLWDIAIAHINTKNHSEKKIGWGFMGVLEEYRSMMISALTLEPLEGVILILTVLLYLVPFYQPLVGFPLVHGWIIFSIQNSTIDLIITGISAVLLLKDLFGTDRENSNYLLQIARILLLISRCNPIKNMIKPLIKNISSLLLMLDRLIIAIGFTALHKSNKLRVSKYFIRKTKVYKKAQGFRESKKSSDDSKQDLVDVGLKKNNPYFYIKSEKENKEKTNCQY